METKNDVRAQFLLEWTRQMIKCFPTLNEYQQPPIFENQTYQSIATDNTSPIRQLSFTPYDSSFIPDALNQTSTGPKAIVAIKEIDDIPQNTIQPKQNMPLMSPVNTSKPSNELEKLILDPSIESIECRGSEEALILKTKKGITQTRISMNPEEMKSMLKKMADEAHSPISDGVIKAETNLWSIFGIISEFGGTRFLIQKKRQQSNNQTQTYDSRMQETQTKR